MIPRVFDDILASDHIMAGTSSWRLGSKQANSRKSIPNGMVCRSLDPVMCLHEILELEDLLKKSALF